MRLSRPVVLTAAVLMAAAAVDGANFCDLIRCSSKIEPVCATNGVSFDNACMFQIAKCHNDKLTLASTGRCAAAVTPKPASTEPVTATPPTATPPTATPAAVTVLPAPAAECEMMCLDMIEPVCGSDGKTYSNKCMLSLANCNNRVTDASSKPITVASAGECGAEAEGEDKPSVAPPATDAPKKNETSGDADANATSTTAPPPRDDTEGPARLCEMLCPMDYQPVCGSNGVTYANACELRRASCQARVALTQVSEGECVAADAQEPTATPAASTATPAASTATPAATTATPAATPATTSCRRACPKIMKPVCGSDGVTYSNTCEFENAKCTKRIATMSFTEGECAAADAATPTQAPAANATTTAPAPASTPRKCSQMCTEMYAPVCGSDGKTYSNKCHFNIAKCKLGTTATLSVATEGECTAAAADADTATTAPATTASSCPRACTQILQPVCGSDGITYNNKCEFDIAKCTKRIASSMMTFKEGACA